ADAQGDYDGDGIPDAEEPAIIGDVRLGSGDDSIILNNGSLEGDIDFGAGAGVLTVDGGARMIGWLEGTDTNADIDINLNNGTAYFNRTETINASDLTIGADGVLYVKVDAAAGE